MSHTTMKAVIGSIAVTGFLSLASSPAVADPWKNESGHGRGKGVKVEEKYDARTGEYKYEEKGPGYKHELKVDGNGGRSEEYKGKGHKHRHKMKTRGYHAAAFKGRGGPPPWAPAWGYRRSHAELESYTGPYVAPFGIAAGRCDRNLVGNAVGDAVGNATGNFLQTKGADSQVAAVVGLVAGALVSEKVGRRMDRVDQACIGQVLEYAPDGRNIAWSQTAGGPRYDVVPLGTYRTTGGSYCREYQTTSVIAGQLRRESAIACRQPNGYWVAS